MDKKRLEIIITSILVLVFIAVWINSIKIVRKKVAFNKLVVNAASGTRVMPVVPSPVIADHKDSEWVRDPFSGKIYVSAQKDPEDLRSLNLDGIIWGKDKPLALINNKVVGVGDIVSGSTVISIKNDRVTLNDGLGDFEIKIGASR